MSRSRPILLAFCLLVNVGPVAARTLRARIDKVTTAVAVVEDVDIRLVWPEDAESGSLHLSAGRLWAADLGYDFNNLTWTCTLRHDASAGWQCAGDVRAVGKSPLRLAVAISEAATLAQLSGDSGRIELQQRAAIPNLTRIDLVRVPAVWAQALLAQAWEAPSLQAGTLDARISVDSSGEDALQVFGGLQLQDIGFDTADGRIAALGLDGRFDFDYRTQDDNKTVELDGTLLTGEMLYGNTYLALREQPVEVAVQARKRGDTGWRVPGFLWEDPGVLLARGNAGFAADGALQNLDLQMQSRDLGPVASRYLTGWTGLLGLDDVALEGALQGHVELHQGVLQEVDVALHEVGLHDAGDRFGFDGLDGRIRLTGGQDRVASRLQWDSGTLYGLPFAAADLVLESRNGVLRLRDPASVPVFAGQLRLDKLMLHPAAESSAALEFGLTLVDLDIGMLAKALGWPEFQGTLSGRIPEARYADNRLDFDGALVMHLFDGSVRVSELVLERPFGTAPTLSADVAIDNINLKSLTGVFGFGSISGRLDGYVRDLRLVDWHATRFDAAMFTERMPGVPQRISQRAVQNISSVGDASFASSLQGRLIALVDSFGYSRIGISCRLVRQVCHMGGLRSGPNTFTIVSGAGVPHLTVIGHNRRVDWPILVARLAAIGKGEVKPVFD